MTGIYVDGQPVENFGAQGIQDYTVGSTEIANQYFQGRNRTSWTQLSTTFGLRPIEFTLIFAGASRNAALRNKSAFDAACFGQHELAMPDGYIYSAKMDSSDMSWDAATDGGCLIKSKYKFSGIQHSSLKTTAGTSIFCESTMPYTDCILSVTVGSTASNYTIVCGSNSYVFSSVTAGQAVVVDGINKRILVGGSPNAQLCTWVKFPYLVPGLNSISAPDTVTVSYYPVFM